MSVLERCPSYKESNKGNKQRKGPTLGVPFYKGVRLIEVSVKRESTVSYLHDGVILFTTKTIILFVFL